MVSPMVKPLSIHPLRLVALMAFALTLPACGGSTSTGAGGAGPGVVPGDPGWLPVQPPDESICVGVNPGPEAWELSRAIAEAAAEADVADSEPEADSDVVDDELSGDAAVVPEDDAATVPPDSSFPEGPDDPDDDEVTDPCSPSYAYAPDCLGAQAPAFSAYDFQPQSCGYGGTYGLDVFRGRVTFVALFWSG
jgi:hypothetical protein